MSKRRFLGVFVVALLAVAGLTPAASAEENILENQVSGLVIRYVEKIQPTLNEKALPGLDVIGVKFATRPLGNGFYAIRFRNPKPESLAKRWVRELVNDSRIALADIDREVQVASVENKKNALLPAPVLLRKATAPRSLSVTRSTASDSPTIARVRLNWRAPSSLFGQDLVGYRVEYSKNGGRTYNVAIRNTRSTETKAFLSEGLVAGTSYRFRVKAITGNGSKVVVGSPSASVSVTPRTTPRPVAITTVKLVGPGDVNFIKQSKADRGGFKASAVEYSGLAQAEGFEDVEANNCSSTRCEFADLEPEVSYKFTISATNPRGTTTSNDEVVVLDEYYLVEWHLRGQYGLSMPGAWHYSRGSKDTVVAVIDSGILPHPELSPRLTKKTNGDIYGYDFVEDLESSGDEDGWDSDPTDMGGDVDSGTLSSFHGTHVAGIIGAQTDSFGITGVAPNVRILPIRAIGRSGGNSSDLVAAINWAIGDKVSGGVPLNKFPAKVINLSLGATETGACPAQLEWAIQDAIDAGVTVVAAAGNNSASAGDYFPANCSGVVAVSATSSNGDLASYSNSGSQILVSAPGGDSSNVAQEASQTQGMIVSTWFENETPTYGLSEGTSMAAPMVAGVVALMYSIKPSLRVSKVKEILQSSVKPFVENGVCFTNGQCGAGILNAHLALARVSSLE